MSTPEEIIAREYQNWVRVLTLIHYGGKKLCLDILHKREGFPTDESQLYIALLPYQVAIQAKLRRRCIAQNQYDLIFPTSQITDPFLFDITLFTFLLQVLFGNKYSQFITVLRHWRNKEFHKGKITYTSIEFSDTWRDVILFLQNNGFDVQKVASLKTCPLDAASQYRNAHFEAELFRVEIKFEKDIEDLRKQRINDYDDIELKMSIMRNDFENKWNDMVQWNDFFKQKIEEKFMASLAIVTEDEVADEVWEIISENITTVDDWRMLSEKLGFGKGNFISNFFTWRWSAASMKEFFQSKRISWAVLKKELHNLNREDIIEKLCEKTNLTKTLDLFLKTHKQHMLNASNEKTSTKPFPQKFGASSSKPMHKAYIDLTVVEGKEMDEKWCADEKDFHQMKFNIPRMNVKNIGIDELVTMDDRVVIVSGIAGIGKSTLYEEIKHRWANNQLLNGENGMPKVDLLLTLSCRELNTRSLDTVVNDAFRCVFPDLPQHDVLCDIRKRTILLIDGADELESIAKLDEQTKPPNVDAFHKIIHLTHKKCFNQIVITSRPKIAYKLQKLYETDFKLPIKRVEISGFNEKSIKKFVHNEFEPSKASEMIAKIKENSTLDAMASIPIFLWVLCGLYDEHTSVTTPSTMTELLLYSSLTFLRNVFKDKGHPLKEKSQLMDMAKDNDVVKYFVDLAAISYKTLTLKKVVFHQDELFMDTTKLDELEKVGFLVKHSQSEFGYSYQYRHLVFQEIFAAIHILCVNNDRKQQCYKNDNLQDCLPLLCGLEGILSATVDPAMCVLNTLLFSITDYTNMQHYPVYISASFFAENSFISSTKRQIWNPLDEDKRLFYSCYVESHQAPSERIVNFVKNNLMFLDFHDHLKSPLYKYMNFWVDLIDHLDEFEKLSVPLNIPLNRVTDFVTLSKKAKNIVVSFHVESIDDYQEFHVEYFSKFADALEANECITKELSLKSYPSHDIIIPLFPRIFCHIENLELNLTRLTNSDQASFVDALKKSFFQSNESKLKNLTVEFAKLLSSHVLEYLCQMFQYLDTINFEHWGLDESQTKILHQSMDEKNKLQQFKVTDYTACNYYPSLEHLKHVETLIFQFVFTNEWLAQFTKELNKLASSRTEKRLKVVRLNMNFANVEVFKKFVSSLKNARGGGLKYTKKKRIITFEV